MRSRFVAKLSLQTVKYYLLISHAFDFFNMVAMDATKDEQIELATKLLNAGNYNDALPHFHEALNIDASDYLTYFKRATVFLALNRPHPALDDLSKALELNPRFTSALVQRANLNLKLGNLDDAHMDYEQFVKLEPTDQSDDQTVLLGRIERLKEAMAKANNLLEEHQYDVALNVIGPLVELMPFNADLLRLRANAYERVGEVRRAINDYRTIAKLDADVGTYLMIAKLCYKLGQIEESLVNVRECLKLDPDNKSCMDFYKPTKKVNNHIQQMLNSETLRENNDCFGHGDMALSYLDRASTDLIPLIHSIQSVMCHCLSRAGDAKIGLKVCLEALDKSQGGGLDGIARDRVELLCDTADLLADADNLDEALKLYKRAQEVSPSRRAREAIDRLKRLQRQRKRRDYYKILGVSRRADEDEINRAYRRLAAKWHPDRHQELESKKKAETMFMDIADAKAVLTDPRKREQYDSGEDPLDPESRQAHHGQRYEFYKDAFAHFAGAGGPFSFKFDFDFD